MSCPIRVVINGFGRIGRTALRQILTRPCDYDIEVVAINDIAPLDICAYLFRYDSAFGPYPGTVTADNQVLTVNGKAIAFWCHSDLRNADLSGIDVVLECTGRATKRDIAQAGLDAGANAVLISGPSPAADKTIVLGANEADLGNARIVSNASCTTNAIAPFLRRLEHVLGVERAHITTIHCYTGSQPTVDVPGPNMERSRAAAVSMVPTTTSADNQIAQVLPELSDRLSVAAVRVPCLSVSAIDATIQVAKPVADDVLSKIFPGCPLIGVTADACVSSDMRTRPESLIIARRETKIVGKHQLRIFGWYDNEWGFSARMIDMTGRLAHRPLAHSADITVSQ